MTRGVYAPHDQWRALTPWERYAARVHAAILRHPDATYAYEAAAALHGLPVFGEPPEVHVLGSDLARSRLSGGVRVHTASEPREAVQLAGVSATSIAETVVDIARARHHAVGLAVADAALRMDPALRVEHLVAVNESRSSSRGRRHARWALTRATSASESVLESVDRAVLEWLGFPEPDLQVWIGGDRVDKYWRHYRIAGEADGDLKYDGRFGDPREAMRARHARDARLIAAGVSAVPHWGWAETIAADPLAALLQSAGLPLVRPREHAALQSLRRLMS